MFFTQSYPSFFLYVESFNKTGKKSQIFIPFVSGFLRRFEVRWVSSDVASKQFFRYKWYKIYKAQTYKTSIQ